MRGLWQEDCLNLSYSYLASCTYFFYSYRCHSSMPRGVDNTFASDNGGCGRSEWQSRGFLAEGMPATQNNRRGLFSKRAVWELGIGRREATVKFSVSDLNPYPPEKPPIIYLPCGFVLWRKITFPFVIPNQEMGNASGRNRPKVLIWSVGREFVITDPDWAQGAWGKPWLLLWKKKNKEGKKRRCAAGERGQLEPSICFCIGYYKNYLHPNITTAHWACQCRTPREGRHVQ